MDIRISQRKSRRIWAATEANSIGWGGITAISKATGIDAKTIRKRNRGIRGEKDGESKDRIRRKGGGRKKLKDTEKNILKALESLVSPVNVVILNLRYDGHAKARISLQKRW